MSLVAAEKPVEAPPPPVLEVPAVVTVEQQREEDRRRQAASEESVPSNVTVVRGESATIYEHRGSGGLYRAEVDPSYGPTYMFDDTDGDGAINDSADPNKQETQMWNLMKW